MGRGSRLTSWPAYSSLMALSQPMIAEEILDAYPLGRHRCLLDVGGGAAAFLAAAAASAPDLRLMLFDLPAVAHQAEQRLRQLGLAERSSVFGGNFFADPLPKGADVVSLVRVLLDHDDASVLLLLRAAREAVGRDGTLLIAEPLRDPTASDRAAAAYFGVYLLAMGTRPHAHTRRACVTAASGRLH